MKASSCPIGVLFGAILAAGQLRLGHASEQGSPTGDAKPGIRAQAAEPSPGKALLPVTIAVVDSRTGKPVTDFECRYFIESWEDFGNRWDHGTRKVRPAAGTLQLECPRSCRITLAVTAPGYVAAGDEVWVRSLIDRPDLPRRVVVSLPPHLTARGILRDEKTKRPVEGATLLPLVAEENSFVHTDSSRAVQSDIEGRYVLPGVRRELGFRVLHADYLPLDIKPPEGSGPAPQELEWTHDLSLKKGPSARGTVRDPAGKPVEGVKVEDGSGKVVWSAKDGAFLLNSPREWDTGKEKAWWLEFTSAGYAPQHDRFKVSEAKPVAVVLKPLFRVTGRVLGPDGRPAGDFQVIAGPGKNPMGYQSTSAQAHNPDGTFSLFITEYGMKELEQTGVVWVGVHAKGSAAWEGWYDLARARGPLAIQLQPGVAVRGKLKGPERRREKPAGGDKGIEVRLVPQRRNASDTSSDETPARDIATLRTAPAADGEFLFPAVRPDNYALEVAGPGIASRRLLAVVPAEGLDLGVIQVRGTGRIVGRAWKSTNWGGGVWARAVGSVDPSGADHSISFETDEDGRFAVDGVAAGRCSISFSFNHSSDVRDAFTRVAEVVEGQSTEVRFFDPGGDWSLPLEFIVGDGSQAQFRNGAGLVPKKRAAAKPPDATKLKGPAAIEAWLGFRGGDYVRQPMLFVELLARPGEPSSFPNADWRDPAARPAARITVPDVHPGKYRLRIGDWQGSIGSYSTVWENDIETRPGTAAIRIPLPAGAILGPPDCTIHVVPEGAPGHVREGRPDFAQATVRYLPEGTYTVYCIGQGWARMDHVAVRVDRVTELPPPKWNRGGTVVGKVILRSERRLPDRILATDARGVSIEAFGIPLAAKLPIDDDAAPPLDSIEFRGFNGEEYAVGELWPGQWTLTLRSDDEVLASRRLTIQGTEVVRQDLVGQ